MANNSYLWGPGRAKIVQNANAPVSVEDLRSFADRFADLTDEQAMDNAWR